MHDDEGVCDCEFDPTLADPGDKSWHYRRVCDACGYTWAALHCPHDGHQNPCPNCDTLPEPVPLG